VVVTRHFAKEETRLRPELSERGLNPNPQTKGVVMRTVMRYASVASMVVLLLMSVSASTGQAAGLIDLKLSGQAEPSTYLVWDLIKKGWDKDAGFKMTQTYFDSGMAQVEALPSKQWVIGTSQGGVPSLVAALRYGTYTVAIGDEDSFTNAVLVRPDSPIAKATGTNPKYPKTYGSADTVRGKTVLVTTISSGHYSLATWLKVLGLKEKDVVVKNMDQGQIMAAFESGVGDIAVVWEPFMFVGMSKGWKMMNEDSQMGANQINTIVVDRKFGDENPEIVAKFLKLYFRRVDTGKPESPEEIAGYIKFCKEWAGIELSQSDAALSLKWRKMYPLDQQLKFFDASKGKSEVQTWFTQLADFFVEQNKFTREEMDKALNSGFITDKFLKMAAAMK
jgi:ABC-type nitrate/sulfonate/bicarbonate transport system substrate-binding protein